MEGWKGGSGGGRPAIVRLCRRRHCQTAGDFVAQGPLPTRPRGGTRRLGRRRGRVAQLGAVIAVAQLAGQGLPVGDEHGVSPMWSVPAPSLLAAGGGARAAGAAPRCLGVWLQSQPLLRSLTRSTSTARDKSGRRARALLCLAAVLRI